MKKSRLRPTTGFFQKHRAGLILCTLFFAIVLFFVGRAYNERPRDLGSKLHYTGKVSGGCLIPLCDSGPSAAYYFSTDMTLEEVMKYFKKAKCTLPENVVIEVDCKLADSSFSFWHYENDPGRVEHYGESVRDFLRSSKKRLVISIDRDEYMDARAAL